jgi:hypothetical protein
MKLRLASGLLTCLTGGFIAWVNLQSLVILSHKELSAVLVILGLGMMMFGKDVLMAALAEKD